MVSCSSPSTSRFPFLFETESAVLTVVLTVEDLEWPPKGQINKPLTSHQFKVVSHGKPLTVHGTSPDGDQMGLERTLQPRSKKPTRRAKEIQQMADQAQFPLFASR